jgi:hypothetical protein
VDWSFAAVAAPEGVEGRRPRGDNGTDADAVVNTMTDGILVSPLAVA